jgi:hypothetical protein
MKKGLKYILSTLLGLTFLFGTATQVRAESFLGSVGEAASVVGQSSSEVRDTDAYKVLVDLPREILDALTVGKTNGGPLDMRFADNKALKTAGEYLEIFDLALKIIEVIGLTVDSVDAWYAGDRAGFVEAINGIVHFAISELGSLGSGVLAGAVVGSVVPGPGTVIGAIGGAVLTFVIGEATGEIVDAIYTNYLEEYVRLYAGLWYDQGHPSLPGDSDSSTSGTGTGTGTTSPPKTVPKFKPLEI